MEMVLGFTGMVSWGYTLIGWMSFRAAGIPLPAWWYPACATALLTAVVTIWVCVERCRSTKRMPKGDPRRLGVIRFDSETGEWYCDPGEGNR